MFRKWVILSFFAASVLLEGTPKIYDCFLLYNELDLLELRLHEMGPYVDYFVVVEATETFRGDPKPLYFEENKDRFAAFADKIIHYVIDAHFETAIPFSREEWQRDQMIFAIDGAKDDDIVMLSDVDEIVRGKMVRRLAHPVLKNRVAYVGGIQNHYEFFMNRFKQLWLGTMVAKAKWVKARSFSTLRSKRSTTRQIANAGWHFSSMGGKEAYRKKLAAYSLLDREDAFLKNEDEMYERFFEGTFVKIDETFPEYLRTHENRFRKIGFIR